MANSASTEGAGAAGAHGEGAGRRDFLFLAGGTLGAFATGASVWPMLDSLNPAKDTLAASTTNVDLSPIEEGQAITVKWRGSPVFIRRRTNKEIAEAKAVKLDDLPDPQTDEQRFGGGAREQWLIVVGVCTHLGCIPLGQKGTDNKGEFGGWFCPCPRVALRHFGADPQRARTAQFAGAALHDHGGKQADHRQGTAERRG